MANRSVELRVGVTVCLALVLLVAGVAWIGQYRLTREGFLLDVDFEFVGGLDEGDPVTVAGMERGKVDRIELRPGRVRVRLWLEPDATPDEAAEIAIESVGMMGEKYVSIRRGSSDRPMDVAKVQRGIYRPGLMEMMAELGDIVDVLRNEVGGITTSLSGTSGTSLGDLIEKMDGTLDELSGMIKENRGEVREAVQDFRIASKETRGFIVEARGETQGVLESVDRTTKSVESVSGDIRDLVLNLQDLVNRIDSGEGSLGKAVNDTTLHDEMVRALRDLDALLRDIKTNPKKYFGVSVF